MPSSGQGRIGLSGPEKQVLEGTLVRTEDTMTECRAMWTLS